MSILCLPSRQPLTWLLVCIPLLSFFLDSLSLSLSHYSSTLYLCPWLSFSLFLTLLASLSRPVLLVTRYTLRLTVFLYVREREERISRQTNHLLALSLSPHQRRRKAGCRQETLLCFSHSPNSLTQSTLSVSGTEKTRGVFSFSSS